MMQVVGLAALPLCAALFHRLPDRGYTLSKAFGLLFLGYIFWILNVIGIFPNTTGAIWLSLFLIIAASAYVVWRRGEEFLSLAYERWWLIAGTEVVFFLTFAVAAYLRSYVPDFGGTEKPMDFMFLNAVTRGDGFPPADPWLAGENVSYYYFGYLLISIMTRLSGLATSVGFNLGLAMIVALAVTGAFGIVYNMIAPREQAAAATGPGTPAARFSSRPLWRAMIFGLIAGLLLAVMGNLEGLMEWIAAHNIGSDGFWNWLNIRDSGSGAIALTHYDSSRWFPDQNWFWWRATRILDGGVGIHEMPFFSFLLGDLHPHVMSIPFVLLAIGCALALLRSEEPLDVVVWLERPLALVAYGLILGALAFINTWDMPTMAFLMALAVVLRNRLLADRWSWGLALDSAGFVLPLLIVAALAYSPFFFGGFESQASGFSPVPRSGTGLFHALMLWGPFAVLVLPYAAWRLVQIGKPITRAAILWSLAPPAAIVVLWGIWNALAIHGDQSGFGRDHLLGWLPTTLVPNEPLNDKGQVIGLGDRIGNRGWNWLTAFVMSGALGLLGLALVREVEAAKDAAEDRLGQIFALAVSATAALLILGVEFIYIQDGFFSRMNTIFKLYYQSWLLLSIGAGYAFYELARNVKLPSSVPARAPNVTLSLGNWATGEVGVIVMAFAGALIGVLLMREGDWRLRIGGALIGGVLFYAVSAGALVLWRLSEGREGAFSWRNIWGGAVAVVLIAAFVYPVLATYNRTNSFDLPRSMDGLSRLDPAEQRAIEWLTDRGGQPVVAEALGDDYSDVGRISAATAMPTILQWPGHEGQWRGKDAGRLTAGRPEDLETLYTSSDPSAVLSVIQKYGVSYVFVGRSERDKYPGLTVPQMTDLLVPAFQDGDVTIYQVQLGAASAQYQE
jgi:YYY domain-containing protein